MSILTCSPSHPGAAAPWLLMWLASWHGWWGWWRRARLPPDRVTWSCRTVVLGGVQMCGSPQPCASH